MYIKYRKKIKEVYLKMKINIASNEVFILLV